MSAYKDKNTVKWYVFFYYRDWKGENKGKTKRGFETKREALEWERNFKQTQQQDLDTDPNVALKEENKVLNKANDSLTKELNQYRRLNMAGVEAELSNVKKLLNRVLEFVEKLGIKAQLEKFLNQKIDKVR